MQKFPDRLVVDVLMEDIACNLQSEDGSRCVECPIARAANRALKIDGKTMYAHASPAHLSIWDSSDRRNHKPLAEYTMPYTGSDFISRADVEKAYNAAQTDLKPIRLIFKNATRH